MDNVMDKIFKITYVGSYIVSGVFLLFHIIGLGFWVLVIVYAITIIIQFFLGYLIQEHLDHILQLYLIILGIATIVANFLVNGFWASLSLVLLGVSLLAIAFIFDEFFDKGL